MSISGKRCAVSVSAVAVLLLAGCSRTSSAPTAAANPAGGPSAQTVAAPQVVPAKEAFWPMYKEAHSWAGDAEVMRVTAKVLPGFRNEAGKAGMWEAVFASPSLHKYRIYTYSIATAPPDVYKGVVAGLEMAWGGPTRDAMPVDLSSFNVDSDAAYSAGAAQAADWLKKNPGKEIAAVEIGDTYKFQDPVWYLMWGTKQSGYATFVDASSGKVLKGK